jgi:DNA-binding NarL/FixJ family response regulator
MCVRAVARFLDEGQVIDVLSYNREMRSVLIIEDNPLVTRGFERLVGKIVHIVGAPTAREGKAALASNIWAAVVVDVSLPDGNGLDVLAWARKHSYGGPALVFSGLHDAEEINRAFALNAQYLVKPASGDELRSFVLKAIAPGSKSVDHWRGRYGLTPAEAGILQAALDGKTLDQIADNRNTATSTTKRQINTLLAKTGDRSLLAAVARFLREGS